MRKKQGKWWRKDRGWGSSMGDGWCRTEVQSDVARPKVKSRCRAITALSAGLPDSSAHACAAHVMLHIGWDACTVHTRDSLYQSATRWVRLTARAQSCTGVGAGSQGQELNPELSTHPNPEPYKSVLCYPVLCSCGGCCTLQRVWTTPQGCPASAT